MDNENLKQPEILNDIIESPHSDTDLEIENLYLELKDAIDELKNLLNSYYQTQKKEKDPEWLTSREVQNYLKISRLTLKRYRERRNIRSIEISNFRFLYHFEDVRKLTDIEHTS